MTEDKIRKLRAGGAVQVLFISEYFKFHLEPLCRALYDRLGDDFVFIETGTYTRDLEIMGNLSGQEHEAYTISLAENPRYGELADQLCLRANTLILGFGQECYRFNQRRLVHNPRSLTMKYKERLFRWGTDKLGDRRYHDNLAYKYTDWFNCAYYILCASAYTAFDMSLLGAPRGKMLEFGYWPERSTLDWGALQQKKRAEGTTILWVGRFVGLKHPETAIRVVEALKDRNIRLIMVGYGKLEAELKTMTREMHLEDMIEFTGALNRFQVRDRMERADILLSTSDYREGWGMVIPEAMADGCCVISSFAAGAAPTLIRHGSNGFLFDYHAPEAAAAIVDELLSNGRDRISEIGKEAFSFVQREWNAELAAERLIALSRMYSERGELRPFEEGICSVSRILPFQESLPEMDQSREKEESGIESIYRDPRP